jgi:hypothetical protein
VYDETTSESGLGAAPLTVDPRTKGTCVCGHPCAWRAPMDPHVLECDHDSGVASAAD